MKFASKSLFLSAVISLTLVGCGTSASTAPSASNGNAAGNSSATSSGTNASSAPTQDATAGIKLGVEKMLAISADLKKAIDAGDSSQVKTLAPQLEDTWSSFEDAVKPKYPDNYAEVEQYLDPTVAGSKVSPLDKATLGKLNDQLSAALQKLEQKVQ